MALGAYGRGEEPRRRTASALSISIAMLLYVFPTSSMDPPGSVHSPRNVFALAGNHVELVRVRTHAAILATVECGNRLHVLGCEFEVEDLEVLLHARRRNRLGEYYVGALDVPAQDDLRRCLAYLLGDLGDRRVIKHRAPRYGRPRLGGYTMLPA